MAAAASKNSLDHVLLHAIRLSGVQLEHIMTILKNIVTAVWFLCSKWMNLTEFFLLFFRTRHILLWHLSKEVRLRLATGAARAECPRPPNLLRPQQPHGLGLRGRASITTTRIYVKNSLKSQRSRSTSRPWPPRSRPPFRPPKDAPWREARIPRSSQRTGSLPTT